MSGTRTTAGRIAAILVGLEAIGVAALVAWQIVALVQGDVGAIDSSLALIVLTAAGAAGLAAFAVAIARGRSWGRSGGIVAQVLILAVALGAATGGYGHPLTALALAAPAVVTVVLLVIEVRAAGGSRGAGSED